MDQGRHQNITPNFDEKDTSTLIQGQPGYTIQGNSSCQKGTEYKVNQAVSLGSQYKVNQAVSLGT